MSNEYLGPDIYDATPEQLRQRAWLLAYQADRPNFSESQDMALCIWQASMAMLLFELAWEKEDLEGTKNSSTYRIYRGKAKNVVRQLLSRFRR